MPVQIKVAPPTEHDLIHKVGSINLEYGVRGSELEKELRDAQDIFLRQMELRGLTLYHLAGFNNPVWVTSEDGEFTAFYALDWEGKRTKKELRGDHIEEVTHTLETSLEDTEGEVEYRIIGVFWSPRASIEILKPKDEIRAEERAARHPVHFGQAGSNTR